MLRKQETLNWQERCSLLNGMIISVNGFAVGAHLRLKRSLRFTLPNGQMVRKTGRALIKSQGSSQGAENSSSVDSSSILPISTEFKLLLDHHCFQRLSVQWRNLSHDKPLAQMDSSELHRLKEMNTCRNVAQIHPLERHDYYSDSYPWPKHEIT